MIDGKVSLLDIDDVEGFVAACMQRSRILFRPGEREELLAEGLVILYELADRYEPHREGYAQAGRFSGYAAAYLPKKLEDAWHRMNPQHQATRGEDGRRVWDYGSHAMSLDHDDMPQLVASVSTIRMAEETVVDRALGEFPAHDRFCARKLVSLIDEGYQTDEIARQLGMGRKQVSVLQGAVASSITAVQNQDNQEAAA